MSGDWHTPEPGTYTYIDPPHPPSDLSLVIGLALLTTDRDADEDAALARVIAVAGLGDLFPGTQGTPAVSSLTEGEGECFWCGVVPTRCGTCMCLGSP